MPQYFCVVVISTILLLWLSSLVHDFIGATSNKFSFLQVIVANCLHNNLARFNIKNLHKVTNLACTFLSVLVSRAGLTLGTIGPRPGAPRFWGAPNYLGPQIFAEAFHQLSVVCLAAWNVVVLLNSIWKGNAIKKILYIQRKTNHKAASTSNSGSTIQPSVFRDSMQQRKF